MRRCVWDNIHMVSMRNQVIVSCCVRHDLRNTMQMRCRVRHYINMSVVRYVVVVCRRMRDILRPKTLLWYVLLLWEILLLRDIGLLRNVVRDVRLMNHVVLKVRLVRGVRNLMEVSCRMRHRVQMISMRNKVSVGRRMRDDINVRILVIVLCTHCLACGKHD